jgi:hypothetical protein
MMKSAKFQCKVICILSYTKMTKSDEFYSFEMSTIHYAQIYSLRPNLINLAVFFAKTPHLFLFFERTPLVAKSTGHQPHDPVVTFPYPRPLPPSPLRQ